jgi:uncharacterized membrane protein HdeD (DUF308 family)
MIQRIQVTAHPSCEPCSLGANWWAFALRGVLAMAFGVLAVAMPIATFQAMTILFGAFATVDGAFHLVAGLNRAQRGRRWGGLVAGGALGLLAGLAMLAAPYWASLGLSLVLWTTVAAWAIAAGCASLQASVRLRREFAEAWLMTLGGLILVLAGLGVLALFWADPAATVVSLARLIGLGAFSAGVVNLALAWRLFRLAQPLAAAGAGRAG